MPSYSASASRSPLRETPCVICYSSAWHSTSGTVGSINLRCPDHRELAAARFIVRTQHGHTPGPPALRASRGGHTVVTHSASSPSSDEAHLKSECACRRETDPALKSRLGLLLPPGCSSPIGRRERVARTGLTPEATRHVRTAVSKRRRKDVKAERPTICRPARRIYKAKRARE